MAVAILVPSHDQWAARFGAALVGAASYLTAKGVDFYLKLKMGSILPQLREELVESALQLPDVDRLIFLDSDQTFPPDVLFGLLRHEHEFVALNIPTKMFPSAPTARLKGNVLVYSSETSPAVGEVWRVGLGVAMIRRSVFQKIQKPWFQILYRDGKLTGEDWWFCERLEEAGIPIMVDHRLSLKVGHIGRYEFTHADIRRDS